MTVETLGAINVSGRNFNVQTSGGAVTVGAGTALTANASNNIILNSGANITTTGGALNVTLNSDADGLGGGAIVMNNGSSIISNGGSILLAGGVGVAGSAVGEGTRFSGISLDGATLSSGAGAITLRGRAIGGQSNAYGINLFGASQLTSTTGAITLEGTAQAGASLNRGIRVSGANITSSGGVISMTGTNTSAAGIDNFGISITSGSAISATGGGVVIQGQGGSGNNSHYGVLVDGAGISASGADISIIGTAGNGTGGFNRGVDLRNGATVSATGAGSDVSITGFGGNGGANNTGVKVSDPGTAVSAGGMVTLTGAGGAGTTNNYGVLVESSAQVTNGNANLTVIGQGGNGGTNENYGVLFHGATVSSAGGTIQVTGTGGAGSGITNLGLFINGGSVQNTGSGSISLTGQAGAGTNGNTGVTIGTGAIISAADGAILISGTGAGSGVGTNAGVLLSASSVTATGAQPIEINGSAAGAALGVNILGGTLGGASHSGDLIVRARGDDSINLAGTVNGTGRLFLEPLDPGTSIGLGGGAGTFNLSSGELSQIQNGFSQITIGHTAGTGLINVGSHTFSDPVIIRNTGAGSAGIVTSGTLVAGVNDLNLLSAGLVNVTQGTISGANIGINAGSLMVQPGVSATASSLVNATGALTVNANTVQVRGSDTAASLTAKLQAVGTVTINAGAVSIEGGNANNASAAIDPMGVMLNVNSLSLTGGAGLDSYALIQSPSGDIIVTAGGAVTLQPGTGSNANAAIVADIGMVTIQSAQCVGCTILATNPVSPPSLLASGIYGGAGSSLLIPPPVIEGAITPPTQILIIAMGESITPPEPEKDKDIFEDIKSDKKDKPPLCK